MHAHIPPTPPNPHPRTHPHTQPYSQVNGSAQAHSLFSLPVALDPGGGGGRGGGKSGPTFLATPSPHPTPRPGPTQFFLLGPFWLSFPFPGGHYSIARQAPPWPGSKPLPQWLTALPRVMALPLGGHRFQLPPLGHSAPGITFRLQLHLSSTFAFFSLCAFRPLLTLAS